MININVNFSDLKKNIQAEIEKQKLVIANDLRAIGDDYVKEAQENKTYKDHTFDLKSDNVWRVYIDGKKIAEDNGRNVNNGRFVKRAFLDKSMKGKGIELVVGNGMEYATKLEAKGYNVVSSGFLLVEKEVKDLKKR